MPTDKERFPDHAGDRVHQLIKIYSGRSPLPSCEDRMSFLLSFQGVVFAPHLDNRDLALSIPTPIAFHIQPRNCWGLGTGTRLPNMLTKIRFEERNQTMVLDGPGQRTWNWLYQQARTFTITRLKTSICSLASAPNEFHFSNRPAE